MATQAIWTARGIGGGGAGPIIPASRLVNWKPGVRLNGGVPHRTTIFTTLSPIGGGSDDTTQINNALINAAAIATNEATSQVVALNQGVYNINGNGLSWPVFHTGGGSFVTLRGLGSRPAAMATGGNLSNDSASALNWISGAWLVKQDRNTNLNSGILYIGRGPDRIFTQLASTNLTADGLKDSFSITVASAAGLSVGQLVIIDSNGDTDPNVFWGNRADLSGYFTGALSSSGNTLTVSAPINGPSGVDGSANVTFSGTSMTINSAPNTGYWEQYANGGNNPVGATVFDTNGNFKGYITTFATVPGPFTLSQSNASATMNVVLGGIIPQVNYPIFDGQFSKFYGFIASGTYPNFVMDRAVPTVGSGTLGAGGGSRRFFSRQERPISQLVRITNISGTTITFETPLYYSFLVSNQAQLTTIDTSQYPITKACSVENIGLFGGMGGDGQGNMPISLCVDSWFDNIESYWSIGTGVGFYGCYRCEVTNSFMHETPNPTPGGAGYLHGYNQWTSDCLTENCIMWFGNKEIVMRSAGGGNVVAYCYLDDAMGLTYPSSPEAGVNAGHQTCVPMALLEGNYSQNFKGDAFWGNSILITIHRNQLSGIRGCSPTGTTVTNSSTTTLKNYTFTSGPTTFPYGDYLGRTMVDLQANSYNHNFTGNIIGFSGQSLLGAVSGVTTGQTTWVYEQLDALPNGTTDVTMWSLGAMQNPSSNFGFVWVPGTYLTVLRSGNWTFNSPGGGGQQDWHGIGGSREYGHNLSPPYPSIPNSYYLPGGATASAPSFFTSSSYGTTVFPWIDPYTGTAYKLPARERWLANTPNTL